MKSPLVVAYGVGVDSTALLIGMRARGIVPDLILFSDTGSEKPETYAYLPIIGKWLEENGMPPVTVVKNPRLKSGDKSLGEACMRTQVLPALAYGQHQCSIVWKIDPQMAFIKGNKGQGIKPWAPATAAWAAGELVTMAIGYDSSPRDSCRAASAMGKARPGFRNIFPLQEWGWDRERCVSEIEAAGLPVPMKSSCFFCPAMKRTEVDWLAKFHPELAAKAIEMERLAKARGLKKIKGLGRSWSWEEHLKTKEEAA